MCELNLVTLQCFTVKLLSILLVILFAVYRHYSSHTHIINIQFVYI